MKDNDNEMNHPLVIIFLIMLIVFACIMLIMMMNSNNNTIYYNKTINVAYMETTLRPGYSPLYVGIVDEDNNGYFISSNYNIIMKYGHDYHIKYYVSNNERIIVESVEMINSTTTYPYKCEMLEGVCK